MINLNFFSFIQVCIISGLLPIYQSPSKGVQGNSDLGTFQPFPRANFQSLTNKSKALEEEIYSEGFNNINNRFSTEDEDEKRKEFGQLSKISSSKRIISKKYKLNAGKGRHLNNIHKYSLDRLFHNIFYNFRNSTNKLLNSNNNLSINLSYKNDYFLGFSGNPFMSRSGNPDIPVHLEMSKGKSGSEENGVADPRQKRSVLHLYNMVLCATGCDPISYKGYGCYCGFLGSGYVVDGIDSCCRMHDRCYNTAGCPVFMEYFVPYLWKCYFHQPICAIEQSSYLGQGTCGQRLCECDRQLAMCLRRFPCPTTKALCTSSPWRLLQNILSF